jgi:hypothetical protein
MNQLLSEVTKGASHIYKNTSSGSFLLTNNFLMVQVPGFIRGINPKSKIENPQAPAFIRGVASKI